MKSKPASLSSPSFNAYAHNRCPIHPFHRQRNGGTERSDTVRPVSLQFCFTLVCRGFSASARPTDLAGRAWRGGWGGGCVLARRSGASVAGPCPGDTVGQPRAPGVSPSRLWQVPAFSLCDVSFLQDHAAAATPIVHPRSPHLPPHLPP